METRQLARLGTSSMEYVDTGGTGPVIVLLHGVLMDEYLWRDVVDRLRPDYRCVVPVLPVGAHRIPTRPEADNSPIGVAALVAGLMEALDLNEVTLVGNDTGGALAQLIVARWPQRVERLVLVSCDAFENFPPGLPGRVMALLCEIPAALYLAMLSLRIPALRRLPVTFGWMAKRPIPDDIFGRWLDAYLADRNVREDVRRLMSQVDWRDLIAAAEKLPTFTRPALIVWAAEDRVMPLEHATRLARRLPDARVSLIEDCYTLIPLDQPERLAHLIAEHARPVASSSRSSRMKSPSNVDQHTGNGSRLSVVASRTVE